jgi:REP element-mobilizing transposase RayT
MITRRCTQRQFLMRPDRETNNAFIYCLGVAAQKFGIRVLFTVAMSNHHHTGIHDPDGCYPEFIEHFHKLFAKCQNALRGRWENFWSSEQTSVVRLVDPNDVVDKMTYALTNPVKDNLVDKAHHWPGVTSLDFLLHRQSADCVPTKALLPGGGTDARARFLVVLATRSLPTPLDHGVLRNHPREGACRRGGERSRAPSHRRHAPGP